MDDDAYPNFGNAFPSASAATPSTTDADTASWNPALRPDAEPASNPHEEEDDDFFDRYPGATPEKPRHNTSLHPQEREESPLRRQSISVERSVDVRARTASPDEVGMKPESSFAVEARGRVEEAEDEEAEDEEALFGREESAEEQARELEEDAPELSTSPSAAEDPQSPDPSETAEEDVHRPEEHYEHQGEVTEMEEAQDLSAEAPLMDDEEPAPTPGVVSREPTFEALDESLDEISSPPPQPLNAHPRMVDRSFTTNFTELPKQEEAEDEEGEEEEGLEERRPVVDEDWPAAGDDKTFGELLGDETQRAVSAEEDTGFGEASAGQTQQQMGAFDDVEDAGGFLGNNTGAKEFAAPMQQPDDAWVEGADDETFGELLGDQAEDEDEVEAANLGFYEREHVPEAAPAEEDLSAAWAAAMDDDEILDDAELDPSSFFGDDDDGLLEDEPFLADLQQPESVQQQPNATRGAYAPATAQSQTPHAQYNVSSTPFLDQNIARSAGTPSTGLFDVYNQPGAVQPPQQQRPALSSAQSFADKAKGGYQSPYDLPMDVTKPRRRPQANPQLQQGQGPRPPPRSSSFGQGMPPVPQPRAPSNASAMSPPTSSHGLPPTSAPATNGAAPAKTTPKTDSGFFADLPMAPKIRTRPSGAYTPQLGGMPTPPMPSQRQMPPRAGPPQTPGLQGGPVQPPQRSVAPPQQPAMVDGFRQPERQNLFPDVSTPSLNEIPPTPAAAGRYSPSKQIPSTAPAPPSNSRYSPAPAPHTQAPARYSPAPVPQPQQAQQPQPPPPSNKSSSSTSQRYSSAPTPSAQPALSRAASNFVPRTSSPLAMHGRPSQMQHELPDVARGVPFTPTSPPSTNGFGLSPERRDSSGGKYGGPGTGGGQGSEFGASYPGSQTLAGSLQRPRTQSPGNVMKVAKTGFTPIDRPGSAGAGSHSAAAPQANVTRLHKRQFSREYAFAVPQDERAQDPLERWKGYPIFKWSAAGTVITSFPKQNPFFGHGAPSIKVTPGMINMQDAKDMLPLNDRDAKFPGPLTARSKGKKKELLAWTAGKVEDLERETEGAMLDFGLPVDAKKRTEEKLVLWKLVRLYLEHDGALEGNPKIEEEVRRILLPNLAQLGQVADLQSPISAGAQPDPVDTQVLAQLRQALFEGQRERAVWLAEEKKLWGHAMLIASTMGPDVWKQIVASFVRSQVKSVGSDARSLAAVYQVFAGSAEDCVDELVPPSARAGFQMISKTDGRGSGNPLEGLDQWRETLALITSNRTPSDPQSLLALGKLLSSYNRVEAASCCFLFARSLAKHSGADDAEAHFTLLGATASDPTLDSIILTEIYEYATSLSAPSTAVHYIPHLQSYKLVHGQQLAAYGLRAKAEAYCSHVDAAIRATTRPSGYYHQALAQELIAFNAFLAQTPHTAGSGGKFSLLARPKMDKVSSGVGSWFTKFVAGDEADGAGQAGGEAAGPFGGVNVNGSGNGEISREPSREELYTPMMGSAAAPLSTPFQPSSAAPTGRYAPGAQSGNRYAPSIPSQFAPSRSSMDSERSFDQQPPVSSSMPSAEPIRPASARYASYAPQSSQGQQGQQSPQLLGVPRPTTDRAVSDSHVPQSYDGSRRGSNYSNFSAASYEPRPLLGGADGFGAYTPPLAAEEDAPLDLEGVLDSPLPNTDAETQGYDPEGGNAYAPPSSGDGGYEPPAYVPYQPDPEDAEDDDEKPAPPKSKKKSFMDDEDDDDMAARAAALKSNPPPSSSRASSSAADAATDAAFRAAAEADAARDAKGPGLNGGDKKGWFGGWFGKGKDPNAMPGPIRAKLGDESSFVFDKELGKWVNKKGGAGADTPAAATPPPPMRGPPSRVGSGAVSMGPPSRAASATMSNAGSRPPTSGSSAPFGGGVALPPSGPPSRAATPAGAPSAAVLPKGLNGELGVPPQRPASSMSTASSLDDLLAGPPGAGKKGTVKGKKRGGRYVDVMAGK